MQKSFNYKRPKMSDHLFQFKKRELLVEWPMANGRTKRRLHWRQREGKIAAYIIAHWSTIPYTKLCVDPQGWVVLLPNFISLIFNSTIFNYIYLEMYPRGGLAPFSQTVGSLLRTPSSQIQIQKLYTWKQTFY